MTTDNKGNGEGNGTPETPEEASKKLEEVNAALEKLEKRPPQRKDEAKKILEHLVGAIKDLPIAPETRKKWTHYIHEGRKSGNVIAATKERVAYLKQEVQALIAIAAEDKEKAFAARVMSDEAAARHVGGLPEETARIAEAGKEAVAEVEAAKQEYTESVGDAMDAVAAGAAEAERAHDWRAAISEREAQLVRKALEIGGGRALIYVPRGIVRGEASGAVNIAIGKEASGVEAARSVSFARKVFAGFSEKLAPQYAISEASTGEEVMRRHNRQEVAAFLPAAEGGGAEPAVWFFYRAVSGRDPATTWQDTEAGGRPMAGVDFSLLLPESFAKELAAAVEANPALVRLFAEQAVQESPDVAQPDRWSQPSEDGKRPYLRPPYERWDAAPGGGKIYIQPLDGPRGWHDEFDRPVRFGAAPENSAEPIAQEEPAKDADASLDEAVASAGADPELAEVLKQALADAEAEEKERGGGNGQKLIAGEIFGKDPDEKPDFEKMVAELGGKDYYGMLGISKNADEAAIKKAYRDLAKQCHPDKNRGDKAAEELFKMVSEAYTVLSDSEKRAKYDRLGKQAFDLDWIMRNMKREQELKDRVKQDASGRFRYEGKKGVSASYQRIEFGVDEKVVGTDNGIPYELDKETGERIRELSRDWFFDDFIAARGSQGNTGFSPGRQGAPAEAAPAPAEKDPVRAEAFARLEDIRVRMRKHFDTLEEKKGKSRMLDAVGRINAAVNSFKELAGEFAPGDAGLVTSMVEVGKLAAKDPKAAWDMAETLIEQLGQAIAAPSEAERREAAEAQLTDALKELVAKYPNLDTKPEYFLMVPPEKLAEVPVRVEHIMELLPMVLGEDEFKKLTFTAAGDGTIAVDLAARTVRLNVFEGEAYAVANKAITSIEEAKLAPFKERLRELAAEYPKASFRIKDENLAAMLPRAERLLGQIASGVDSEWIAKQLAILVTDEGGADSVTLEAQPGGLLATVAQFNLGNPDPMQPRLKRSLADPSMKHLIERKKAEEEKIKGEQRQQAHRENKRNAEREKNDSAAFEAHLTDFKARYPGFDITPLIADRALPEAAEILRSVEDILVEDGPDLAAAGITEVSFTDDEEPLIYGKNELRVPQKGGMKGLQGAIDGALDRIEAILAARDVLDHLPRGFAYESDASLPQELHFKKKGGKGENKEEYADTTPVEGLAYAARAVIDKVNAELGEGALARAGMTLYLTNLSGELPEAGRDLDAQDAGSRYSSSSLNAQTTRMVLNINMGRSAADPNVDTYMDRKQVAKHAVEMIRHEVLIKAARDIRGDSANVLVAPAPFLKLSPEAQKSVPDRLRSVATALRNAFPPDLFEKFSFDLRPSGPALAFDSMKWRFTVNALDGDPGEIARKAAEAAEGIAEDLEELRFAYPKIGFDLAALTTLNRAERQRALPDLRAKLRDIEAIMPNLRDVEGVIFEDGAELRLKGKEMRVGFNLPADRVAARIGTIIAARWDMQQAEKAQAKTEAKYPGKRVNIDFTKEITTKAIVEKEQPEPILRSWSAALIVKDLAEKMDPAEFAELKLTITDSGEDLRKTSDGYVLNLANFKTRDAAEEEVMRAVKREKKAKLEAGQAEGTLEEQKLREAWDRVKRTRAKFEMIARLTAKSKPGLAHKFRLAEHELAYEIARIPSSKMEAERPRLREKAQKTLNALMPSITDSDKGLDFKGEYGQVPKPKKGKDGKVMKDKSGKDVIDDKYDEKKDLGSQLVDALFDMNLHYRQVHPNDQDPDAWSNEAAWQAFPHEEAAAEAAEAEQREAGAKARPGRRAGGTAKEAGKMKINLVGKEARGTRPADAPRRPRPAERPQPQPAAPESRTADVRWESLPEARELARTRTEYAKAQVVLRNWEATLSYEEQMRVGGLLGDYGLASTSEERENIRQNLPEEGRKFLEEQEDASGRYYAARSRLERAATSAQRSVLEAQGLEKDVVDRKMNSYSDQLWDEFSPFGEEGKRLEEERRRIYREGTF